MRWTFARSFRGVEWAPYVEPECLAVLVGTPVVLVVQVRCEGSVPATAQPTEDPVLIVVDQQLAERVENRGAVWKR
jgi:hypothetical protein